MRMKVTIKQSTVVEELGKDVECTTYYALEGSHDGESISMQVNTSESGLITGTEYEITFTPVPEEVKGKQMELDLG